MPRAVERVLKKCKAKRGEIVPGEQGEGDYARLN